MMIVVDGEGMIFGRLSTFVAKKLLQGEEVSLINAEKILISGMKDYTIERYNTKRRLKNKARPERSSSYPRHPHLLVKRMIRGMLPWKKPSGKTAFRRLRVYAGKPEAIKETPAELKYSSPKNITKYMKVKDLCKMLGYEG